MRYRTTCGYVYECIERPQKETHQIASLIIYRIDPQFRGCIFQALIQRYGNLLNVWCDPVSDSAIKRIHFLGRVKNVSVYSIIQN